MSAPPTSEDPRRTAPSLLIPKPSRAAQKVVDHLAAKRLAGALVGNSLVFEAHAVLDGRRLTLGNCLCARADDFRKRPFRHECIDQTAAESLGGPLERMQRYAAAHFRLLKLHDPWL